MNPIACKFGWHRWAKWEVIRQGRYISRSGITVGDVIADAARSTKDDLKDGMGSIFKEQQRQCDCCGLIQLRTVYS
jgi:hypothetical protein